MQTDPCHTSALRCAAAEGDVARLERLLADGDSVHAPATHGGFSALEIVDSTGFGKDPNRRELGGCVSPALLRSLAHLAGFHDHPEAAWFLFQRAALASSGLGTSRGFGSSESDKFVVRLKRECIQMLAAARRGDTEAVGSLLQEDALLADSVDDIKGETAFAAAFANGHRQLCELLLRHGARAVGVCIPTKSSKCSLVKLAVSQRNAPLVRWLLELGANPSSAVDGKKSALSLAAFNGDHEIVDVLLANGARLDKRHCSWIALPPPLDSDAWALDDGEAWDYDDEDDEDHKAKLQVQTPFLLLSIASLHRHRGLIRYLFSTQPELKDPLLLTLYGSVALALAVYQEAEDVLTELLHNGVSFQSRITSAIHPIYAAVAVDSVRLLRLLRRANAVHDLQVLVTLSGLYGSTACLRALLDCPLIPNVLYGVNLALVAAIEKGQTDAAIMLIERSHSPLNATQASRCLNFAIDRNDGELIELLIAHSPVSLDILQQSFNEACLSGSEAVVAQLLAFGVDVNAPITAGSTFLLHQVLQRIGRGRAFVHIARLLLESGACIDLLDSLGETAFEVVARRGLYIKTPASKEDLRDVQELLLKFSGRSSMGGAVATRLDGAMRS